MPFGTFGTFLSKTLYIVKYNYFVFGNLHGRLPDPFACLFREKRITK